MEIKAAWEGEAGKRCHRTAGQRTQEPGWQPNPADPEASLETGRRQEGSNGTPPSRDNKAAEEMWTI